MEGVLLHLDCRNTLQAAIREDFTNEQTSSTPSQSAELRWKATYTIHLGDTPRWVDKWNFLSGRTGEILFKLEICRLPSISAIVTKQLMNHVPCLIEPMAKLWAMAWNG